MPPGRTRQHVLQDPTVEGMGMVERDWQECVDPAVLLHFLRGKASDRKLRLFTLAACRRIQPLMKHRRSREALRVAELFADSEASGEDLETARRAAKEAAGQDEALVPQG